MVTTVSTDLRESKRESYGCQGEDYKVTAKRGSLSFAEREAVVVCSLSVFLSLARGESGEGVARKVSVDDVPGRLGRDRGKARMYRVSCRMLGRGYRLKSSWIQWR